MEKKLSRIITPSQAMTEYREIMLTAFDHRLSPHLSFIVFDGLPRGLDRRELEQKKTAFSSSLSKIKKKIIHHT